MPTGSFRGGLQVGNTLYAAYTGEVYTINDDGEINLFSTLGGSDHIFIARNNRSPDPHIAVVANSGVPLLISTTASAVIAYPDGDVGTPSAVWDHMGYIMFGYGDGDIQASDLNATSLNTLNVARTESNPDGVLNGISYNGDMYVFGEKTVEVWGEPTNASGFPITRRGFNILPGLKTAHAIAGWQPEFGQPPIWVGSDNTVRQLDGFVAREIGTPDLNRLIAAVVFPDDTSVGLEAIAYVSGGNAYWQLNGPTWSWVYHTHTKTWHERKSQGSTRSRFKRGVFAFSKSLVGDRDSDDLWAVDHTAAAEAGTEITAQMESSPAKAFPNRQRIRRADFDFTAGVGEATGTDPMQTDPSVLIEVSKDGGYSWPLSYVRKLGRQAQTGWRTFILNAGLSGDDGVRWRWSVSDPVHVGFQGSSMDTEVETK